MTELFNIGGLAFFEHPTLGDESGLVIKTNGKFYITDLYDRPDSIDEAQDIKDCALRGAYIQIDSMGVKNA